MINGVMKNARRALIEVSLDEESRTARAKRQLELACSISIFTLQLELACYISIFKMRTFSSSLRSSSYSSPHAASLQ